jgi:hypothetical protein
MALYISHFLCTLFFVTLFATLRLKHFTVPFLADKKLLLGKQKATSLQPPPPFSLTPKNKLPKTMFT